MSRMLFLNLPVKDLDASVKFFGRLGFEFNAEFTDETATAMVVNDQAMVMLLVEPKFREFLEGDIADTSKGTEALICISADSRDEVDELAGIAVAGGGSDYGTPADHGFMYGRAFRDLDGHVWEVMWMDPAVVPE